MKAVTTVPGAIEPKFIEALGCEGYTHYEIASSLCARPDNVIHRIESLIKVGVINPTITVTPVGSGISVNTKEIKVYNLTVGDAKVVAAKYDNEHGYRFLKYLIVRDEQLTRLQAQPKQFTTVEILALASAEIARLTETVKVQTVEIHDLKGVIGENTEKFHALRVKLENPKLVGHLNEAVIGKQLKAVALVNGHTIHSAHHKKWGKVNVYDIETVRLYLKSKV